MSPCDGAQSAPKVKVPEPLVVELTCMAQVWTQCGTSVNRTLSGPTPMVSAGSYSCKSNAKSISGESWKFVQIASKIARDPGAA